ncbi:MAG TPA: winged helix-turn-helix transcriptional regulator [Anaerolineae bacterium]|nr:winged helix-turn-helix transcriptional regulator [Anaerolineae bacterium]
MLDSPRHPQPSQVIVDIAPTINALHSLSSIADARDSPGIGSWAAETREKLSEEEWENHLILMKWIGAEALINILPGEEPRSSFPAYLHALSAIPPEVLRDELFNWMTSRESARLNFKIHPAVTNPRQLLESREAFLDAYTKPEKPPEENQTAIRVFDLLSDPPALKDLVLNHLTLIWETHLKEEWDRRLPELEEAVEGYKQINVSGMSHFEVIEAITRRNVRGVFRPEVLQEIDVLRFIPSPHSGPYILKTGDGEELQITFGAYQLGERVRGIGALEGTQVVDRLKALGDETRLEILRALKAEGELRTQEIIDRFALSKSAASRHMRQLVATGIVDVRTDEDGLSKFYRLNQAFVGQFQEMLGKLLG